MEPRNDFALEPAVARWRARLARSGRLRANELDELEAHLWDVVDARLEAGDDARQAFETARWQTGHADLLDAEFDKLRALDAVDAAPAVHTLTRLPLMLTNHLKVALRDLRRHPGYAAINVTGLAVGMACFLLILLYVQDEWRFDRHHEHADRVFRVTAQYTSTGRHWAPIGPPTGPALQASIPEVERVARIFPLGDETVLRVEDQPFETSDGVYADSTVFDVFTLPLVRGRPDRALTAPHSIVLSESLARTLFGGEDPMGKTIQSPVWQEDLTVTGVMQDVPTTTHLPVGYLVSLSTFYATEGEWLDQARTWAGFYTYVRLASPSAAETIQPKLLDFIDGFYAGVFDGAAPRESMRLVLQPLTDIHLRSSLEKEYRANGDVTYLYVFSVVALLVLLIACINFVNLSTARATRRMREVGVRKSLGASRHALMRQFMGESVLLVVLALAAACLLIAAALPLFNTLAGKSLALAEVADPGLLASLGAVTLLTGLASGLYPAFVLSSFRPTEALRGGVRGSERGGRLRRGLVVAQFAASLFLITSTLVVFRQLDYFRDKQLGFDKAHVLNVDLGREQWRAVSNNLESVRQELLRSPSIEHVSLAADAPGKRYSLENLRLDGRQDDEAVMMRIAWGVDHHYAETLGLRLTAGRDFSEAAPADTSAWLVNEAAVRRLELEEPVGKVLRWGSNYAGPIVGVVEDFHFASLHHTIEPLVIPLRPGVGNRLLVRVRPGQAQEAVAFVEGYLNRLVPDQFFHYSFLDDDFERLYRAEDKLGDVFTAFSVLAVLIACLGLLGLAAFMAAQRTKEIGVRKVLGATVPNIVGLLASDFLKLVVAAFILAAPPTYFALRHWLADFAYRAPLRLDVFLWAGLAALVVAFLTVSYHAVRAATANPVKALRYE